MRCPKRGEAFIGQHDKKYMSVVDKSGDVVRCISQDTKKQTSVTRAMITHIFTPEESAKMLKTFFEGK